MHALSTGPQDVDEEVDVTTVDAIVAFASRCVDVHVLQRAARTEALLTIITLVVSATAFVNESIRCSSF